MGYTVPAGEWCGPPIDPRSIRCAAIGKIRGGNQVFQSSQKGLSVLDTKANALIIRPDEGAV